MPKAGRDLEQLVARLEGALAGAGVTITSPDFFTGRNSGVAREIDVSLRHDSPSSGPILVMVECRDRGGAQDVTWIDGLVGKRDDVGADRAIAVSRSGFSAGAESYARAKGINLRRLHNITDEDVLSWVRPTELRAYYLGLKPRHIQIQVLPGGPQPSLVGYDHRTRCIRRNCDGVMLCAEDIWHIAKDDLAPLYEAMKIDGLKEKGISIVLIQQPGWFEIDAEPSPIGVAGVLFEGTMTLEVRSSPVDRQEYVSEDGTLMRVAEATFTLEDETFVLSAQEKPNDAGSAEQVIKVYKPGV